MAALAAAGGSGDMVTDGDEVPAPPKNAAMQLNGDAWAVAADDICAADSSGNGCGGVRSVSLVDAYLRGRLAVQMGLSILNHATQPK